MTPADTSQWNSLQWRRRLERFGEDDGPIIAAGPSGEVDGVWWVTSQPRMESLNADSKARGVLTEKNRGAPRSLFSVLDSLPCLS